MKVTQEKLPDSQIGLEIEVPAESAKKTYESVVKNLTRNVNIPGFRRGKVPRHIVMQRLGQNYIKATVVEELVDTSVKAAIAKEELRILGNLKLQSNMESLVAQFDPDAPLTFQVTLDVFPTAEYEADSYKTLSIQAEEIQYDPALVDNWLKDAQKKRATLVPVEDRPAAMEDMAIVDYRAFRLQEDGSAGEAIEEVQGTDFNVNLEDGRFVKGIVEGIVGMNAGESKQIPITFPEDYPLESVAGDDVIFEITVKEIKVYELPELDDEFAEEISEFETLAALRESLENQFKEEAATRTDNNIKAAIKKSVGDLFTGELPVTLIQEESERLVAQTAQELERMGLDLSQLFSKDNGDMRQTLLDNARPEAIANIKSQLMIADIAKQEDLKPSEDAIKTKCDDLRRQFQGQKVNEDRLQEYVYSGLLEENVLNWLKDTITVELVPEGTLTPKDEETAEEDASQED